MGVIKKVGVYMARQHEIRIKVTREEYENIKLNAKILDMKVAPYIRQVAQNPHITIFDYASIRAHTKQIGRMVDSINLLVFTIEAQNNYQPKEIDGIYEYIKQIWESENKLLELWRKHMIAVHKQGRSIK